ncbi:MAG: glutamate 5-kinase [Bermanella sp.]|jgi:glutamate 5-kinase
MSGTAASQRWVVKIGSALLTANGRGLWGEGLDNWVSQMVDLRAAGHELVLVSSGAVAEGMTRLGWARRPEEIHRLQAAAAVGQMGLIQAYESRFSRHGLHTAQILLGHDDISARDRYLNARGALQTLLELGVVPVVNENDTVVTDEIRLGDNDTLAALVANLVDADVLVILTDQAGLFDKDPRHNREARLIEHANASDSALDGMVSGAGALGRGGMVTKLRAARLAARAGADTIIASGTEDRVLQRLLAGESVGTRLSASRHKMAARKQWLAGQLQLRGRLELDDGAVSVLTGRGSSLLAVGVISASGNFQRGDLVACVDAAGREIARGLVNYNADETQKIVGQPSSAIAALLGYHGEEELIHRDNLVLS